MTLQLKKWDPCTMNPTSTIYIVMPRGGGKTTLLRDIMYCIRKAGKINVAVGFSPTEESTSAMDFLPRSLVHTKYDEIVIKNIYENQKKQWRRGKGSHVGLLLDDCAFDSSIFKSEIMKQLFLNGRHRRMMVLICSQYSLLIPPMIRSNLDVVIAGRDPILANRKKLYESFFGVVDSFAEFDRIFNACTQRYGVLVLVNNTKTRSNRLEDRIFWYRAKQYKHFKFCDKIYWDLDTSLGKEDDEPYANEDGDDGGDNLHIKGPICAIKLQK